jgi:hypothetical protein
MRLFVLACLAAAPLPAQQNMAQMNMGQMAGMPDMPGMSNQNSEPMQASGTSVNPAASPMAMVHFAARRWTLMLHGVVFVTDIQQTGPRGADKFASMNWFMAQASHPLAGGTFSARSMLSLDPATITGERYPELFQTGETAYGKPIVDGQHPHDLFMELALEYTHPLTDNSRFWIYLAPVGDPALGPVAYPHRVSAAELPQATLGHHLEDSTHISDDVVTLGASRGIFGIEASGFHGAEPGENRWIVQQGTVDSWSGRFTVAPNNHWSAQVSAGRLTRPEALEPGDQIRTSASVTYVRPISQGDWATSLIWGRVHKTAGGANLNAFDLESVARFRSINYLTARAELVDKDELFGQGNPLAGQTFRIGAITAGYTRDFNFIPRIASGLGVNITQYAMPAPVHEYYGSHPVAVLVFLRFRLRGV